jgi:hypothetical protein
MASRPHWINPRPAWLEAIAEEPGFKWAVTAWARAAEVETAWFDAAKADAVVAGWPHWFHLTDDRFAGLPFKLNAWQEIIVRLLVGWKVAVEILDPETHQPTRQWVRLFRRLLLWVPRKNGKSEFLAALALLFWALDGIVGGQGYVFARDEDQAELPFNKMKAMVGYNPELAASIQSHKKSLYLKECATAFQLLTGAEEGKHGKGANVILGDEMHEWKSRKIETDLRGGTGTRLEPIELYASTAGLKTNLTGVELWDESLAILEGRVEEPTTLVALFAAEPEDDWRDEKVWNRPPGGCPLSSGMPAPPTVRAGAIGKASRAAAVSAVSTFRRPAISPLWCGCSSRCRVRKNGCSSAGFGCPRTRSRSASRMPATRCRSTAGTASAHSRPRPAIMSTRVW